MHLEPSLELIARRQHSGNFTPVLPLQLLPRIHAGGKLLGVLRIELQLLAQRRKFRTEVIQFHGGRGKPIRQRLTRCVDQLKLTRLTQQRAHPRLHTLFTRQTRRQRRRQLNQLLRPAHALKIPLQRLDCLVGQFQRGDAGELIA